MRQIFISFLLVASFFSGTLFAFREEQRAIAISLLDILDDETIAKKVGLKLSEVKKLRKENR